MAKEFKKLLGHRVYLEVPKKEESKIVVDENTKEALNRELMKTMRKLKVIAVGAGITDPDLQEGSYVLVDPEALSRRAVMVPLDKFELIEGKFISNDKDVKTLMLISYHDIIHIW